MRTSTRALGARIAAQLKKADIDIQHAATARDLGVDPRTIFRYLEREPDAPEPGG